MTAYVIADDCVPQDSYFCVRDQCSRTVASVKAKLHLMLRPYYILTITLFRSYMQARFDSPFLKYFYHLFDDRQYFQSHGQTNSF